MISECGQKHFGVALVVLAGGIDAWIDESQHRPAVTRPFDLWRDVWLSVSGAHHFQGRAFSHRIKICVLGKGCGSSNLDYRPGLAA